MHVKYRDRKKIWRFELRKIASYICYWDLFHIRFFHRDSNFLEISYCSPIFLKQISLYIFARGTTAAQKSVTIWWRTAKRIFHRIRITMAKLLVKCIPRWRHQMKTFSALLALCVGNSPATGELPSQKPVTRSFVVSLSSALNKRLSKQSWGWWFETPSHSLWRHCNASFTRLTATTFSDMILADASISIGTE